MTSIPSNMWAIQTNGRISTVTEERLMRSLRDIGSTTFGVIDNEITGIFYYPNISFIYGSIKLIRLMANDHRVLFPHMDENEALLLKQAFVSSIYFNHELFSYDHWMSIPELKPLLINGDAEIVPINTILYTMFNDDKFCKPVSDLKSFTGLTIPYGRTLWEELNNGPNSSYLSCFIESNENVIINRVKQIGKEYRFFVVDKKVVAWSQYAEHGIFTPNDIVAQEAIQTAEEYVKLFQPSSAFVIDIGETESGYQIIEYNCINCSGFYEANVQQIVNALELSRTNVIPTDFREIT